MIPKDPSPEVTLSRMIIAPSCPKHYCNNNPILYIDFYNSTVFIESWFWLRSAWENIGSSGFFKGSSAKNFIMETRLLIGWTTIWSVSFDKMIEPKHMITHVKIVKEN